jgi:ABC-type glycerol-3-phosphate transport system permease component
MELEVTWGRAFQVWWSYLWRNLIAIVVSMLVGIFVGAIMGFVMGMLGFSLEIIRIGAILIGIVLGLVISVIPIKMILGKDFGEFRLALVAKGSNPK